MFVKISAIPLCLASLAVPLCASTAAASVNLALEPTTQIVGLGATVNVGIYAFASTSAPESLGSFQMIFSWNPAILQLAGTSAVGGSSFLSSGFFHDPYGINESSLPSDGSAIFFGLGQLGGSTIVPASGVLLSTLVFTAIALSPPTPVSILPSAGSPIGQTVVYDGTTPNTNITGTLAGASVQVGIPAPAVGTLLAAWSLYCAGLRPKRPANPPGHGGPFPVPARAMQPDDPHPEGPTPS